MEALYEDALDWSGTLHSTPSFFHATEACGGQVPVPNRDWFTITTVANYD